MIVPTREMLKASGTLYIIENVNQARRTKKRPDGISGHYLCGTMFGLPIYRHRRFETNFEWLMPSHAKHTARIRSGHALAGRARDMVFANFPGRHGAKGNAALTRKALGVEWMGPEASQAIPPAYSEHIGNYAMTALGSRP